MPHSTGSILGPRLRVGERNAALPWISSSQGRAGDGRSRAVMDAGDGHASVRR
jgi:hypothetical protein